MTEAQRPRSHVIGMGGVGLVIFYLSRLGYECVTTAGCSRFGDIWVQVDSRKLGIEVKTTLREDRWKVSTSQFGSVDLYCFVHLGRGECYVLTADEVEAIAAFSVPVYDGVIHIRASDLPDSANCGWERLTPEWNPLAVEATQRVEVIKTGSSKTPVNRVTKRLADGTIRQYEYPRSKKKDLTFYLSAIEAMHSRKDKRKGRKRTDP